MIEELDIRILRLTDAEQIAFLEHRHALLIQWLHGQISTAKAAMVPEPHPLLFSMASKEEEDAERYRINLINGNARNTIGMCEYFLEAIENGNHKLINDLYKKKYPGNEYQI